MTQEERHRWRRIYSNGGFNEPPELRYLKKTLAETRTELDELRLKVTTMEKCPEHSGFEARISDNEDDIKQLWDKWDKMNSKLIGALVALTIGLVLNLVGVIVVIAQNGAN
jgi:hypothetical protein